MNNCSETFSGISTSDYQNTHTKSLRNQKCNLSTQELTKTQINRQSTLMKEITACIHTRRNQTAQLSLILGKMHPTKI